MSGGSFDKRSFPASGRDSLVGREVGKDQGVDLFVENVEELREGNGAIDEEAELAIRMDAV